MTRPTRSMPNGYSPKSSASKCRTNSSRSAAGSRVTSCPTPTAAAAIFFAGDAAHLNHPSSGLGLNTGLGDAVDLGWKLSATLAGWGGGALLDSYEIERQPVGRRNIGHADVSHANDREREPSPQIFQDTPAGEQARRKMGDAIVGSRPGNSSPTVWRSATAMTRLRSAGTRPASSPTPRSRIIYPNAITGSRAPHAWLAADRSILDLFGRGFTLLRFGDAAPEVSGIERGFAARGVPLTVKTNLRSRNCRAL